MVRRRLSGFTLIEVMVVIVVIAVLAGITTIAYRATQNSAKETATQTSAVVLMGAIEDYYSDNGIYPTLSTCDAGSNTCTGDLTKDSAKMLLDGGYIGKIPQTEWGVNFRYTKNNSPPRYGILIIYPDSSKNCRVGKNMNTSWWAREECTF